MTKHRTLTSLSVTAENFLKLEDDSQEKHSLEISWWASTFRK